MAGRAAGPSRVWYWIAGALIVSSVVLSVVGFVLGLSSANRVGEEMQRVPLPGTGEVSFTEAGRYELYYVGVGSAEGEVPLFSVSLVPANGGEAVPIDSPWVTTSYGFGAWTATVVGTFRIDSPGRYVLEADLDGTTVGSGALAVGRGLGRSLAGLFVAVGVALVLFLLGVVVALVVALRRRSPRRPQRVTAQQADGSPWPGWFPDVTNRHELRYWDGRRWTEHVVDAGRPDVDPLAAPDAPR